MFCHPNPKALLGGRFDRRQEQTVDAGSVTNTVTQPRPQGLPHLKGSERG